MSLKQKVLTTRLRLFPAFILVGLLGLTSLTGCKKEGCTDPNANNYNDEAKKDNSSCTYPSIMVKSGGNDGDVTGRGGTATATHNWNNNLSMAELNMDLTSSKGGSFSVVVTDAEGLEVINKLLRRGLATIPKPFVLQLEHLETGLYVSL